MRASLHVELLIVLCGLLLFSAFAAGDIPDTDCTENPDAEACQQPFLTDDQDIYFHDLSASWIFNSGTPDTSSVTMLHGGQAGDLGDLSTDTADSGEKTEYFIDEPGEADSEEWGKGALDSIDLTVPGAAGSDSIGEFLVDG